MWCMRIIAKESKLNPKKLWKYITAQTKPRSNISHLINNKTGKLTENEKEQVPNKNIRKVIVIRFKKVIKQKAFSSFLYT